VNMYEPDRYPYGLIGPTTFIPIESSDGLAHFMIKVHPSIKVQVEELMSKMINTQASVKFIHLEDAFCTFELTGPRVGEILGGILQSHSKESKVSTMFDLLISIMKSVTVGPLGREIIDHKIHSA
jgi:hypothetical protein